MKKLILSALALTLVGCVQPAKETTNDVAQETKPEFSFIRSVVNCELENGQELVLDHNLNSKEFLLSFGEVNRRINESEVELLNHSLKEDSGEETHYRRFSIPTEGGMVEVGSNWIVGGDKFVYLTYDRENEFDHVECKPETIKGAINSLNQYN